MMNAAFLEELASNWEVMADMEEVAEPGRRAALRECADTLRMLMRAIDPSSREKKLEDLLRSACAIAERKGAGTAWDRFATSINAMGLTGITARTYRILPSDEQD